MPRRPSESDREARLDAQACELRAHDLTFAQIAERQKCSVSTAYQRVNRHYRRLASPKVNELKRQELVKLDAMELAAWKVLESLHITVQQGRVVMIGEKDAERPIPDDAPVLQAIDRLLRVQERRSRLIGLDAPVRHSVDVVTKDAMVAAMEQMNREMAEAEHGESPVR